MKQNAPFHPVVRDEKGTIRSRFNKLHNKIRLEKKTLAARIFSKGMDALEKDLGFSEVERAAGIVTEK